jgi:L-fuculose-phosphate aldolase
MSNFNESDQIIQYGRRLYEKGFVAATDGNLSIRRNDGNIFITGSGLQKGFLKESDLAVIDSEGNKISGERHPSSEKAMHLFVYKSRPDIMACCHAHPPYSTAYSIAGRPLPSNILPEVIISVGDIALTDYAPPGTEAVPRSLEKYIHTHEAFILRNHGVLTIGRTMEEAYNRMEIVEHYAKIVYIAANIGPLNFIDTEEINRLKKIKESLDRNGK